MIMSHSTDFLSSAIPNFWNRRKYRINRDARLHLVTSESHWKIFVLNFQTKKFVIAFDFERIRKKEAWVNLMTKMCASMLLLPVAWNMCEFYINRQPSGCSVRRAQFWMKSKGWIVCGKKQSVYCNDIIVFY